MRLRIRRLMASAVWLSLGVGLSLRTTNDANTLARALIKGPGITRLGSRYRGASDASGTFTDGFYNINSGIILTSGRADGATTGSQSVENGQPGYGTGSDASVLSLNFRIEEGYSGFELEFIFATEEIPERVLSLPLQRDVAN